jgi:sulfate permease, SulP family
MSPVCPKGSRAFLLTKNDYSAINQSVLESCFFMAQKNVVLQNPYLGGKMQDFDDTIFGNPVIDPNAFISSRAQIIGDVVIERNVIIKAGAAVDADEGSPFRICKGTNMQEQVLLHGLLGKQFEVDGESYSIYIGSHCSIAHRALIHGPAIIQKKSFVGFDAIVHNSKIGRNCFIDFQAVVKNSQLGDFCHIGVGAKVVGVVIQDRRWVGNGMVIDNQDAADLLPIVLPKIAHEDAEFNKEVVEFNKQLVALYKARRRQISLQS